MTAAPKKPRLKSRGYTPRGQLSAITDDVPLPRRPTKIDNRVYPFVDMLVGQSFTCPEDRWDSMRIARWKFEKANPGTEFITRRAGFGIIRTWRTK